MLCPVEHHLIQVLNCYLQLLPEQLILLNWLPPSRNSSQLHIYYGMLDVVYANNLIETSLYHVSHETPCLLSKRAKLF